MKQSIRRFIAPWMIAVLPLSGCASMNQQGSSMMPQWIAGTPKLDAKLAYGRLCERHGQTKQAHDIYQMLANTRNAPIKQSALHRMAVMAAKRGDFAAASERFAQASRVQAPSAELLNDMGYNFYLMDNLAEAETCFRKAIEIDPQYTAAQNNLGLALGQQGKFDDAMKAFAKSGNSSQAHTNMAYVYAQHRYLDQARQHYLKALGSDEKNERAAEGLIQVAKAFDNATKAQAAKSAAENSVAKSTAPAAGATPATPVADVVDAAQPVTKVAVTAPAPVTPSPATTLPAATPAPAANNVAKTGVSTRRFETPSVSPWADQAKAEKPATPPVAQSPALPSTPVVASSQPVASAPIAAPLPSPQPVAAPLSQPIATIVPDLVSSVTPAPIVPGVSLPKPVAKPTAAPTAVANLTPSVSSETKWATNGLPNSLTSTQPNKPTSTQVTLGQPTSIGGNSSTAGEAKTARPTAVTVTPTAPLLPANPVQVASPTAQSLGSAVVTAGHSDVAPEGARLPVTGASPNVMPPVPSRLPTVTPAPANRNSSTTPSTAPSASYPTTQTAPASAFPAAQRVGKPTASSNALMADLLPKLPKPAEPVKVTNVPANSQPALVNDSVRQASFVDKNPAAANQAATVSDFNASNPPVVVSQPDGVKFPASLTIPSVLPKGVSPTTPKLPSTPVSVAPPTLKTNTEAAPSATANRFASMKAAKDQNLPATAPRSVTSTIPPAVPVTTLTPPNQTTPSVPNANVLPKPIHLEINGKPATPAVSTPAPAPTTPANAKNYLPSRDGYKAPAFKTPANEVPGLTESYRSRGLGLDGSAGSK